MGCHPKILTYTLFDQKYLSKAPSHVLVVDPATGAMENKLLTDGAGFSASSVGFPWEDMFIVGSSKDDGFLVCRRK